MSSPANPTDETGVAETAPPEAVVEAPVAEEPGDSETGVHGATVDPDTELDTLGLHEPARLRAAVEAVLFVTDGPLTAIDLAVSLRVPEPAVTASLQTIAAELDERGAGVELRELAAGYRYSTRSEVAPAVERFLRDGQRTKLSQAALETLAVVAYRQPVTRARIGAIRGVSVDGVIRTLLSRGLIAEVGVEAESQAGLYSTTDLFLDKIGLGGLDELPSLAPLLPDLNDLDSEDGVDFDAF